MGSFLQPGYLYWDGFKYIIVSGAAGSPGPASGDLSGMYPNPEVIGIDGIPINFTTLTAGNTIVYNGTSWVNQFVSATGVASGDLAGFYPNPSIAKIQGTPIVIGTPSAGQVLGWNGTTWTPTNTSSSFTPSGDLSGTVTNQTVVGLQTRPVSSTLPAAGQVLEWNGTSWAPVTPSSGFTAGGDLNGTSINQTVVGLQARPISAAIPSNGQTLVWNGTSWTPTTLSGLFSAGTDLTGTATNQYIQSLSGANGAGGAITLASTAFISASLNTTVIKVGGNPVLLTDPAGDVAIQSAGEIDLNATNSLAFKHGGNKVFSLQENSSDMITMGDLVSNCANIGLIRTSYNGGLGQIIIGVKNATTSFGLLSTDNAINTVLQAPTGSADILNVNGTNIFQASSSGIALGNSPSYGSGTGVFFLQNAGVNPSTSPSGGAILYATSGNLWVKPSIGSAFEIQPAASALNEASAATQNGITVTSGTAGSVSQVALTPNSSGIVEVLGSSGPGAITAMTTGVIIVGYDTSSTFNVSTMKVVDAKDMATTSPETQGASAAGIVSGLSTGTTYYFYTVVVPSGDNYETSTTCGGGIYVREVPL